MNQKQMEKWAETRARGMLRFVLLTGMLAYGLPMFVLMTFVLNRETPSPAFIGFSAVGWLIGGAVFGIAMWFLQERMYRKAGGNAG